MRKQGNKTKNVFKFKSTKYLLYPLKIILQDLQINIYEYNIYNLGT